MDAISRNIADLSAEERLVLERFVGSRLGDDQRIVVQITGHRTSDQPSAPQSASDYAILADLDDEQADGIVEAIRQRSTI